MVTNSCHTVILHGRWSEINRACRFSVLGWLAFLKVKVSRGITQCSPTGLEPMPHTSMALMAQYLNVRQRKLGTIIIQTFFWRTRFRIHRYVVAAPKWMYSFSPTFSSTDDDILYGRWCYWHWRQRYDYWWWRHHSEKSGAYRKHSAMGELFHRKTYLAMNTVHPLRVQHVNHLTESYQYIFL